MFVIKTEVPLKLLLKVTNIEIFDIIFSFLCLF